MTSLLSVPVSDIHGKNFLHISCSKRLQVQHEVCQLEVRGACNKVLVKLEEGKNLFQITHPGAIKALTRGVPVFMTAFTDACMPWPMKRGQAPITAFFQRKQVRRISIESVNSDSDNDDVNTSVSVSTSSTQQLNDAIDPIEDASDQDESESLTVKLNATARREAREDLTGILQRRELVGCASTRQFIGGWQGPRRRRKQQLVRWALTHFQRLPMELRVLLAAGASNGIIALYDFDDVFHRSLNLGQKVHKEQNADKGEGEEEQKMKDEILHPIHTIFTPFEVKRIRWNPLNEDEIACSFTNRNEIYMFDLRKFPSKPHKVLKSSNQPSSGYNDLLYLPATQSTVPNSRQLKAKSASKAMNIIAGDMDGAIRMWDPRFPLRPVWSFLAGSLPINALLLSPNKQFLICGNEAGMLMTYDIQHKVVPAFGSKPVPQRKASFNIMEVIKLCAHLKPIRIPWHYVDALGATVRNTSAVPVAERLGSDHRLSIWHVVKLHTFIRGLMPREKAKADPSPSVLSMASESEYQRDFLPRSLRNSWLSCHRCAGTFLFDKSIICTGIHDVTSLNVIDLRQLRRIETTALAQKDDANEVDTAKLGNPGPPAVERLDRFRIPMDSIITAVAAHPNQHAVICGGENMRLQVMGAMGQRRE
ncbi:WD40-repeat-containing domain [Phytophthora cactorum]|nr:WD40-repeat-containing domain [Phytophthora cactorum]